MWCEVLCGKGERERFSLSCLRINGTLRPQKTFDQACARTHRFEAIISYAKADATKLMVHSGIECFTHLIRSKYDKGTMLKGHRL
jgi:hypothetical protein